MNKIYMRAINDMDMALLETWLNKDYILKWYHNPNEWLYEINERNGSFAWINHFIVMEDDTPIGFCQYYDCYNANDMEDWYNVPIPCDTFSIDYLIGDSAYLGKGYGKAIVKLLTDTIREKEHAKKIIVQPEKENNASNHVLIANGYVYDEQNEYYCKFFH